MKFHLTLLYTLLFLPGFLSAMPDPGPDMKGLVKGQIVDAADGTPLEYATVSVYQLPDSSLITGGITDGEGIFSIELKPGRYYLEVAFISYQKLESKPFEIARGRLNADLDKIEMLADATTLQEVEVRAEKSRMQMSLDKRVFNVGKDLANIGGSATDVLNNVPSVTVDVEGNVSLRGSGGVRILINGRPSGLVGVGDNDGLRNIPANLIERIEVITNPSARYEAEGMAGIINIILKKEKRKGWNGSVDITAGYPDRYGLALNTNYRVKKWNFFANYGLTYRDSPGSGSRYQEVYDRNGIGPDTTFIQDLTRDRSRGGWDNNIRLGVDYSLSETSTLTANFIYSDEEGDNISEIIYRDFINSLDNPTGISTRTDNERELENDLEYVVAYRKNFKGKGHTFTTDIRFQDSEELEKSNIREAYFTPEFVASGLDALQQRSNNLELQRQLIWQADYVRPFAEEGKFEIGLRAGLRDIETNFQVDEFQNNEWENLPDFTNNFLFDEDVYAAYTSIGNKYGNFSFQAGLRAEYTEMITELVATDQINPREYFNLFPSVFFGYDFSDTGNAMQVSYSRRINRPSFWSLNPFFSFSDARNIFTGNPNLDPEFTDSYEVNYLKYWENASITAGVFYRHTTGVTERIQRVNSEGITFTQPENLATEDAYGLDFTFSFSPKDWWDIDGNVNFFRSIISGVTESGEDLGADAITSFGRITSQITLWNELNTQIRFNYRAPRNDPQGRDKSMYFMDLTLSKDILNKKGTLTFSVSDVFNTQRWRYTNEGPGFFSDGDFQWRARQALLTFSYRINQQKKKKRGYGRGGYGGGGGGDF
ncbi:MAG: TonB-dependent receptor [Phaeodactylibacter sp.]|nr:TonB-dependent receptor [Phaeodactylibacter sp.]